MVWNESIDNIYQTPHKIASVLLFSKTSPTNLAEIPGNDSERNDTEATKSHYFCHSQFRVEAEGKDWNWDYPS